MAGHGPGPPLPAGRQVSRCSGAALRGAERSRRRRPKRRGGARPPASTRGRPRQRARPRPRRLALKKRGGGLREGRRPVTKGGSVPCFPVAVVALIPGCGVLKVSARSVWCIFLIDFQWGVTFGLLRCDLVWCGDKRGKAWGLPAREHPCCLLTVMDIITEFLLTSPTSGSPCRCYFWRCPVKSIFTEPICFTDANKHFFFSNPLWYYIRETEAPLICFEEA